MNNEEAKPTADELLQAIQSQEKQKGLGRLKIFFGMSAGVGKTYAMLEEAQHRLKEGINVVVGTVNTHGRKETQDLLQGLPIIAEKWVKYRDIVFEEMDLKTIIETKPQLVLVDELAHTNVPGSKHTKRWQDVIEILDNGIDVYTTLNVQHIESRKDIVEGLTGIQVHETVPDLILERASSIELIDLPPVELLQRLHEGKVYLGDKIAVAADHFFKEENLMALRELALRFTAEKVDHDLHGILHGKGWKTRERLLVAISSSPSSEQLIRETRRLAFELDAPWLAVYVDTGQILNDQDQARLSKHFNLARDLGAEVITTHDLDIAEALQRIVRQKDISRLVVGRPPKKRFSLFTLFQPSFFDRLENENKQLDIVILRQESVKQDDRDIIRPSATQSPLHLTSKGKEYGLIFLVGALVTSTGYFICPYIGYQAVGFIFLGVILLMSFFVGRGPIFLAALLSAICWDIFFIPPAFSTGFTKPEDIALASIYFFVAAVTGTMTARLRETDLFLHQREETAERLIEIERDIINSTNVQMLRLNISSRLERHFPGKFDILVKGPEDNLIIESQLKQLQLDKEKMCANWVFQNGKMAGWTTDTLPASQGLFFPIKFLSQPVGVLVYYPQRDRPLISDEINFIQTVNQQLGTYLERQLFEAHVARQDFTRQTERIHQAIFHSLNRSFYGPLDEIVQINRKIQIESRDSQIQELSRQMQKLIATIKLTVDNIIAISELESGFVHFSRKLHPLNELIEQSIKEVKPFINGRQIRIDLPSKSLSFAFDFVLLKLALNNLILNAVECSGPESVVCVKAAVNDLGCRLSVLDNGPGIPEEIKPLIFDKFYRASNISTGLGLGLAIVKAVVDIHRGKIEVKNREAQGTDFSIILPAI